MLMFTLTISGLTTSNLPWLMHLTFHVPMQYCSLQHQILLSPPDTFTTECHFQFGPALSFFLELFFHRFLFCWAPISLQMLTVATKFKKWLLLGRIIMTNLDSILKSRDIVADRSVYSQSYCFSSNHVWAWEVDHKEGWALKNSSFWIVLENTLESSLDIKEITLINPEGTLNIHWKDWCWGWNTNT